MSKKIIAISKNEKIKQLISNTLEYNNYEISYYSDFKKALEIICQEIPNLILIDTINAQVSEIFLINNLKYDPIFISMIIIFIVADDFTCDNWKNNLIDDYIRIGSLVKELKMRVELSFERVERMIATNPLTRLPGNLVIQKEIQSRLDRGEIFALAYADLDNFKPFNDKYGFSRGDEIIKMLGRIIMNIVRTEQPHGNFIGHIGGDDFVYIMKPELIESTTIRIIEIFNNLVRNFYDIEDLKKGYIESVNRQGEKQIFPIMTLSVGITSNKYRKFNHFSEMAEAASEMKSVAKKNQYSKYAIDRRKNSEQSKSL
ncbi:MAG: diguanylate cyclase [Thermodesulfovibrio sp.]|uniref:diguanylate cyclase n=1 Tax=Thermodesulfovibrio sp. 1176 TaxID=3043424 RepID=UPI002482CB56|nr:diguanylate cyclase [Thermodesulfovibrio sp. 1176]MDI1471335.1 diguanylate cyclase [Thermodesulfovibrio sp. 1176]MDI6714648.1 diguanylate cyclase [Thermodesulfovibrio sp.]